MNHVDAIDAIGMFDRPILDRRIECPRFVNVLASTFLDIRSNAPKRTRFHIRRLKCNVRKVFGEVNHMLSRAFSDCQNELRFGAQFAQHAENGIFVAFSGWSMVFGFGEHQAVTITDEGSREYRNVHCLQNAMYLDHGGNNVAPRSQIPGILAVNMKHHAFIRFSSRLLAASFVFANLGCSDATPAPAPGPQPLGDPLTYDVTKPGLYTCGHRILQMTYTPPALPSRTIPVEVWYPSTSTDGLHPKYQGVFEDLLAYDDVPLAPTSWKLGLPVLVHSHGYKGFAGNSGRLMCHFASHGWLAVAPAHKGNLINDTPATLPLDIYIQRPHDIRAALDFIDSLPADDELSGKADMTHVAMSGHSFGSYTAWAIAGAPLDMANFETRCQMNDIADCTTEKMNVLAGDLSEPRAKIAMPLAGTANKEIGDAHYDLAKVPVLMMSGSLDISGQDKVITLVKNVDLTWVNVENGCHQLYGLGNSVLGDPACTALPDEEGFSLVNPWILAYARYHVWQDRTQFVADLVERKASLSPKVIVQHAGP